MKVPGTFLIALLCFCFLPADAEAKGCWTGQRVTPPIEITERDLTKLPRICSLDMTVYGVRLGMSVPQALLALHQYEFDVREEQQKILGRTFHNIRVTWENREILTIAIQSERVEQIVLQQGIAGYLEGDSPRLFESAMAEADSPTRRRYLGREDRVTTERDEVLSTVVFVYGAEGLEVRCIQIGKVAGDPRFSISLALTYPEKQRS